MIIVDIWGGDRSLDHVARHIIDKPEEAMRFGVAELNNGYLVNLRRGADFGPQHAFETRTGGRA